uniref:Uncharacterized protein n=1 Tax=Romanomermis culicivorax TaxID=13658 RepID=A0A915HXV6_ROMCU
MGSPARTLDYETESGTESRSSTPDPGRSTLPRPPTDITTQYQIRNAQSVKSQACVLEPRRSVYSRTRSESNILAPGAARSSTTGSRGDTDDGNDNEKLRLNR